MQANAGAANKASASPMGPSSPVAAPQEGTGASSSPPIQSPINAIGMGLSPQILAEPIINEAEDSVPPVESPDALNFLEEEKESVKEPMTLWS